MAFELTVPADTSLPDLLATITGSTWHGDKLLLPPALGTGYLQMLKLGRLLTLMVHQYELNQDVRLRKAAAPALRHTVVFSFRNLFQPPATAGAPAPPLPTVRVSSADLDFELYTPAHTRINAIIIAVDAALFSHFLPPTAADTPGAALLQTVIAGGQSFLYEELLSPAMQAVAAQIIAAEAPAALRHYYLKLKAEELIYLFLAELLKRPQAAAYPLTTTDAQRLYQLRDLLVADLSTPPSLPALARHIALSESKMKRLFKQVFGTTIYDYYQVVRMNEAARLLQSQQFTVSEVGYQLGFTNLSHFTRLFERHHGRKPKQYSKTVTEKG